MGGWDHRRNWEREQHGRWDRRCHSGRGRQMDKTSSATHQMRFIRFDVRENTASASFLYFHGTSRSIQRQKKSRTCAACFRPGRHYLCTEDGHTAPDTHHQALQIQHLPELRSLHGMSRVVQQSGAQPCSHATHPPAAATLNKKKNYVRRGRGGRYDIVWMATQSRHRHTAGER